MSSVMFDSEINLKKRKRNEREIEDSERPLMKNLFLFRERPQLPLPYVDRVNALAADPGRSYSKKLTHMYEWEFDELCEILLFCLFFLKVCCFYNIKNASRKRTNLLSFVDDVCDVLLICSYWKLSDSMMFKGRRQNRQFSNVCTPFTLDFISLTESDNL